MEASRDTSQGSKSLKSATEMGIDILWKFQLRKENAALLEKLEANSKQLEALAAESQNLHLHEERISALEVKIARIECEKTKEKQVWEKWHAELIALKLQMSEFVNKRGGPAELEDSSTERPPVNTAIIPVRDLSIVTAPPKQRTTVEQLTDHIPTGNTNPPTPMQAVTDDYVLSSIDPVPGNISTSVTPLPARRSSRKSVEKKAHQHSATLATPPTLPKLIQGTSTLPEYLNRATKTFAAIPKDAELEFIALFIKGIRDVKSRAKLIHELQQNHPSRTKRDGKQEILCKWLDVEEGLRILGLVELNRGGEKDACEDLPQRRKRKILIPPELIASGKMR